MPEEVPVIGMRRYINAPVDAVWSAMIEPSLVEQWFCGDDFACLICEMDLRHQGLWRHVLRAPGGAIFEFKSIFVDVDAPTKISWINARSESTSCTSLSCTQAITLDEVNGQTQLSMVAVFESVVARDRSAAMGFVGMVRGGIGRLAKMTEAAPPAVVLN